MILIMLKLIFLYVHLNNESMALMEIEEPILFPTVIWNAIIIPAISDSLLDTLLVPLIINKVLSYPFPNPIRKAFVKIKRSF